MKHQLLIVVALLLALALFLTACGRNENTASDPVSSDAETESSVHPTGEPTAAKTYVDDGVAELDNPGSTQAAGTNGTTATASRGATATKDDTTPMTVAHKTGTTAPIESGTTTTTKKAVPSDPDFNNKENYIIVEF